MRKRILSLLLAVVMTVGLLPTAAFAVEGDTHSHKVCAGADAEPHKSGTCGDEEKEWTAWNSTSTLPTADGYYYLTEPIT